jgi:hypothetical protein
MPAIPGLPELGVVEKPLMNPRAAGKDGAAIAGMGEDVEGMAEQSLAIEAHMREAQKHVDIVAAQNELNSADDQLQINLKKTQNSRDVAAVVAQAQEDRNSIAAKWSSSGSPAAVEIQQASDRLKPRVDHLGQMRQIDLMGKELDSQNTLQMQKLMPDLVTAIRNGDTAGAKAIQDHVSSLWDSPLVSDAEKQTQMEAFREATQKQLNEAAITSADPAEREQAISQLTKGGKGPLDLTNLPAGDLNALRVHAEETNQRLNNLAEARSMNGALNVMDAAFQAPEYKDNFEAQQKALQDPEWLKQHGIVAPDGSPDRIKAEKLSAEVERKRTFRNQEQADHDEKTVEKISPLIDENKMSRAQIDQIPGLSARAHSALIRQWTENYRLNRSMNLAERQQAKQEQDEKSAQVSSEIMDRISSGAVLDPMDIKTAPGLTPRDKTQLLSAVKMAQNEPHFRAAAGMIQDNVPLPKMPKNATPDQVSQYNVENARQMRAQADTYDAFIKRRNEHPEELPEQSANEVLKGPIQQQIRQAIDKTFGTQPIEYRPHSMNQYLESGGKLTVPAIKEQIKNEFDYVFGVKPSGGEPSSHPDAPSGFDVKVQAKDGTWYWGNSKTKEIGPKAD